MNGLNFTLVLGEKTYLVFCDILPYSTASKEAKNITKEIYYKTVKIKCEVSKTDHKKYEHIRRMTI